MIAEREIVQVSSLDETLAGWARTQPQANFITEAETGRTLSYGEALRAVRRVQRLIGRERRTIVLSLPGGIAASVVWLAALGAGHRVVLCSPEITDAEKARLAERYRPEVAVVAEKAASRAFGGAGLRVVTRDEVERAAEDVEDIEDGFVDLIPSQPREDGMVCLTTSGTTGEPKGVSLTAPQIAWTAAQICRSHHLTPADRGLTVLPFFHINAPVVSLSATLLAGASVVIAPRFRRSEFWGWIERERVTWASIVPTIVAVLLQTERPSWLPGRLRFVRTASAPLPAAHLQAFEERFGLPVIETYGLSEAASQVAANPVPPGLHKPGSVGLPTGVETRLCRSAREVPGRLVDVGPREEGEICISGPSVIAHYDGNASSDSFIDGWFRTGDMGYRDEDGYIFITGRIRDVINRGGEKISPREVEEVLLAHPDVKDAVVVGRPDPIYGQRAVAYVVPDRSDRGDLEASLRGHAAKRLTRYKVPTEFILVDDLPRTRTGKIQRHLLGSRD